MAVIRWYGETFKIGDKVIITDREGNPTGEEGTIAKIDDATHQARLQEWCDGGPEFRTKWVGADKMKHAKR